MTELAKEEIREAGVPRDWDFNTIAKKQEMKVLVELHLGLEPV